MRAFLDTSVFVSAFYPRHPHHELSIALVASASKESVACAAHTVAEIYASLTRMPPPDRVSPQDAVLYLSDLRERLTIVPLSAGDYSDVIESAAALPISGGAVYDALIARCAPNWKAGVLYTWNERHFRALGPEVAAIVRTP